MITNRPRRQLGTGAVSVKLPFEGWYLEQAGERTFPALRQWVVDSGLPLSVDDTMRDVYLGQKTALWFRDGQGDVRGFAVVWVQRQVCHLVAAGVYPGRCEIGAELLRHVEQWARPQCRCVSILVPDTCLHMHKLLKSCGYVALGVISGVYSSVDTDSYLFIKRLEAT